MIEAVLFVALTAVALAAAAMMMMSRGGPKAPVALALALAGVILLYAAPGLALVELATIGAAGLVVALAHGEGRVTATDRPAGWRHWLMAAAVTAGLVFVLVGTWARQFVWTGRELPPGAEFGALPGLAEALVGAPGLLGIGLVMVVAAAACAKPGQHRI